MYTPQEQKSLTDYFNKRVKDGDMTANGVAVINEIIKMNKLNNNEHPKPFDVIANQLAYGLLDNHLSLSDALLVLSSVRNSKPTTLSGKPATGADMDRLNDYITLLIGKPSNAESKKEFAFAVFHYLASQQTN